MRITGTWTRLSSRAAARRAWAADHPVVLVDNHRDEKSDPADPRRELGNIGFGVALQLARGHADARGRDMLNLRADNRVVRALA